MNHIIFNLLVFFSMSVCLAQTTYTGKVIDTKNIPVAFANVIVYKSNDRSVKEGTITDENGNFKITLNETENYHLEISFLGFKTKVIPLKKTALGNIIVEEEVNSLNEVVVKSKKINLIRKNDRLIFSIENTVAQELGSAVDVLKVTPNIVMRDDQLSMLGKNFIRVMVNGKMMPFTGNDLRNYLSSINSNDIKSIEVITTPPSEFDAEGNGGIINIILKKQKNDFWSLNARLSSIQRKEFSYGRDLSFNYKKKNTYLTLSASNGKYLKNNLFRNATYYDEETWYGEGPNRYDNDYTNYRFSITQNITKNWEMGASYAGSFSDTDNQTTNRDSIFDTSNTLKYIINSRGLNLSDSKVHAINYYNTIQLDTVGKKVSIDLDYFTSNAFKEGNNSGEKSENNINQPIFSNATAIDYSFKNISNKIDFFLPFKGIELKAGTKISLSKTTNDFKFYDTFTGIPVLDNNQSNHFNYEENIYAGYVSGTKQLSEKLSGTLGLRVENTVTESYSRAINQTNTNKYTKLFPTLFLTYSLENNKSLSFNVSRRLNRPSFESLDPFKMVLNPFKTVQGNPFLKPSYLTSSELIFNTNKNELKAYSQWMDDGYEQISEIDPNTKIINYTYYNYIKTRTYGITDTYIFDKLEWLTSYNTIDIGYSIMSSSIPQTIANQEGFNAFIQTQNSIRLDPKNNLSLGINYYYVFPAKNNLSKVEGYGPLDISLRLKLLEGNLNLSLYASDVLYTSRAKVTNYYNGIRATYKNYYDTRYVSFTARYTFGNKKIYSKASRFGNDDIQSRATK
ncbi:TonB-dependent receptor domain-containing protein [Flavobacterium sp. NRK F7]|uniref:TonB-dependent receptor domain-containing protein n=1 Tax=Flavobacterium sp. NRK F7 TaxID=2954930 RepID=UPI00209132BC|nr:TonB-dependent receptor [Flavobacterium sp. NRK F7]MCO6161843.1 TonB-dependent receptor [Flavobacterium sp. NRK F7]